MSAHTSAAPPTAPRGHFSDAARLCRWNVLPQGGVVLALQAQMLRSVHVHTLVKTLAHIRETSIMHVEVFMVPAVSLFVITVQHSVSEFYAPSFPESQTSDLKSIQLCMSAVATDVCWR